MRFALKWGSMPETALQFDPESHRYSVNGAPYVSVTQAIGALKLTPPYPEDDPRGLKDLGSAVHRATELAMWDRLDDATTSTELLPYVNGAREKKLEMNIRPIATELQLYDPLDGIAGTLDLFCWIYKPEDWELAIIDYKRSDSVAKCTELQLAGYERLLRRADAAGRILPIYGDMDGARVRLALHNGYPIRRFSMKLLSGRSVVREYRDDHDHAAWSGAIELFKWMSQRPKNFNE